MAFFARLATLLKINATVSAPDATNELLSRAETLEAENRWDEALQCYDHAIQQAPTLALAYFRKGNILLDRGEYQKAADAYASALQYKPDSAGAQLNMGTAQQELGHSAEAETHFLKALELNPRLWDAWQALGDLQAHQEQWELAATSFETALSGQSDNAQVCFKRALALHRLEQWALAETGYKKVLSIAPQHVEALHNLGALALTTGKWSEAASYFEQALLLQKDNVETLASLGTSQLRGKNFRAAVDTFRQALALDPAYTDAYIGLCGALRELGSLDDALTCIRQATDREPLQANACIEHGLTLYAMAQYPDAENWYRKALLVSPADASIYNNLGAIKRKMEEPEIAVGCFQRAIDLEPDFAEAHLNLGNTLQSLGRYPEAMSRYEQALSLAPEFAEAHLATGSLWQLLGNLNRAEDHYRRAVEYNPALAHAYSNLGTVLGATRRYEEAMRCYDKALELKAESADALVNRSNVLKDTGRVAEAIEALRQALELDPRCMVAHHNLLFNQNYLAQEPAVQMLANAQRFGTIASATATPYNQWLCTKERQRKLRIGFVSGDFLNHPVGHFLENVLAALQTLANETLEVVCYPTRICEDALSQRMQRHIKEWTPVYGMSDAMVAQRIHNDHIDVLFDLSGHTGHNRLPMFAWKPAPIQVSWIGYFATTGLPAIDYFMADPWTMSASEEAFFTEEVWRLPETRLCFTPPDAEVSVGPLPALSNGHITFACFNNLAKINDAVLDTWVQILKRLPTSKLFIKSQLIGEETSRKAVVAWFTSRGIVQERLLLEDYGSRQDYLAVHNKVDIALDPFPFPGGTTTAESLWMGVPVMTLEGEHFLSRQGAGLLGNAGLTDWIARDVDDYIERTVAHASDMAALATLRIGLRKQVLHSPIFDSARFARHFEAAIRDMWIRWCESEEKINTDSITPKKTVTLVSATRMSESDFWKNSALGRSLQPWLGNVHVHCQIAFENTAGLPEVYNRHILQSNPGEVLVFLHDDVWLDDPQWLKKTLKALGTFDVIGIAGNTHRVPHQPSWAHARIQDGNLEWDARHLSGEISHGPDAFGKLTVYGPTPAACELLDGVFLAANAHALRAKEVTFDPRFKFHFYDLDFCRTAKVKELNIGTWPIAITHQSGGAFGTPSWHEGFDKYLEKWGS